MALYNVNPHHIGSVSLIAAANETLGTYYDDVNSPKTYGFYIKDADSSLRNFKGHRSLGTWESLKELLAKFSQIEVAANIDNNLDINAYLAGLRATNTDVPVVIFNVDSSSGLASDYYFTHPYTSYEDALELLGADWCLPLTDTGSGAWTPQVTISTGTYTPVVSEPVLRDQRGIAIDSSNRSCRFVNNGVDQGTIVVPQADISTYNYTSSFNVSVLAYMDKLSTTLLNMKNSGQTETWRIAVDSNLDIVFVINDVDIYNTTVKWYVNERHHVQVNVDSNNITILVDGNITAINNTALFNPITAIADLRVADAWQGLIQYVTHAGPLANTTMSNLYYIANSYKLLTGHSNYLSVDRIGYYKTNDLPSLLDPNSSYFIPTINNGVKAISHYVVDSRGYQSYPVVNGA